MIGLLRGELYFLDLFVDCFIERLRKTLITFFGNVSMCGLCSALFSRNLVLTMLVKGVLCDDQEVSGPSTFQRARMFLLLFFFFFLLAMVVL